MPAALVTHWVDWDAIGRTRVRALCGVWIRRREHANAPTCPECRRYLAARDRLRLSGEYDGTVDWNEAVATGTARRRGDV